MFDLSVKLNLPAGDHDNVNWKHAKDTLVGCLTMCWGNLSQRHNGDVLLRHHWVFHLGFAWYVVEMEQWGVRVRYLLEVATTFLCTFVETHHLDIVAKYHRDVIGWCFIWDYFKTSWKCTNGKSLLRILETSLQRSSMTLWRCNTETPFHLKRTCNIVDTIRKTSPRCSQDGW